MSRLILLSEKCENYAQLIQRGREDFLSDPENISYPEVTWSI